MKKLTVLTFTVFMSFSLFGIDGILVKTIDKSFQEKWNNTISTNAPKLIDAKSVHKHQQFYLTTIAWKFELDKKETAHVNYAIKMYKPDGSIHFEQKNLPILKRVIKNKNNLQMSKAVISINFEAADKFGEYKIEVQISDEVSAKSKSITTSIVLKELPKTNFLKINDVESFTKWFERYYESPKPETALSYFLFYAQSPLSEDDNSFLPIFSIFLEIFKNNKFLFSQVVESYKEQDERTKTFLIYLIYYADIGNEDFFNKLEGIEKQVYTELKGTSLPKLYGTITVPAQLDMLWASFTTNGSYKPILKLIQTLEYTKFQGALDKFKTSEKTEEDRQNAINNAIYDALVWSFKSHCKQHELVKSYAKWALKYEELSTVQRSELKVILDSL